MKRILLISHSASLTGAPILLWEIARRIDRSRFKPHILLPDDGPLVESFSTIGPTTIEPMYPDEVKYWREVKRIGKRLSILRQLKPDLVYCNTIHPAKWLVYARFLGIPTVTHVHELGMGFSALGSMEHLIVKRFSNRFIAVSEAVKRYLVGVQHVDSDRVEVVRAGINVGRFRDDGQPSAVRKELGLHDEIVVGTVGRITPMKGSDLFLRLAASLKKRMGTDARVKFLVIGTTQDRVFYNSFQSLLDSLGLRSDILLLEDIPDAASYFGAMDIYVATAREDPFPLVIMEAMAAAKPVVAFEVGGIPEAITADTGILVPPLDLEQMCDAVALLIRDPARRNSLGACARSRVKQQFNLDRNIGAIEHIIDSVIGAGAPSSHR